MKGKTGKRNCFNCAYFKPVKSGKQNSCKKGLLGRRDNPETECVYCYWQGKRKDVEKI